MATTRLRKTNSTGLRLLIRKWTKLLLTWSPAHLLSLIGPGCFISLEVSLVVDDTFDHLFLLLRMLWLPRLWPFSSSLWFLHINSTGICFLLFLCFLRFKDWTHFSKNLLHLIECIYIAHIRFVLLFFFLLIYINQEISTFWQFFTSSLSPPFEHRKCTGILSVWHRAPLFLESRISSPAHAWLFAARLNCNVLVCNLVHRFVIHFNRSLTAKYLRLHPMISWQAHTRGHPIWSKGLLHPDLMLTQLVAKLIPPVCSNLSDDLAARW